MISKLARLAAYAVIAFLAASPGSAQDADAPLHIHPQLDDSGHFYSTECCHENDCAPIDPVEIRIEDGFYVWESWRVPGNILRLAVNSPKIKPSMDNNYHPCEGTAQEMGYLPSETTPAVWPRCLYVPTSG